MKSPGLGVNDVSLTKSGRGLIEVCVIFSLEKVLIANNKTSGQLIE